MQRKEDRIFEYFLLAEVDAEWVHMNRGSTYLRSKHIFQQHITGICDYINAFHAFKFIWTAWITGSEIKHGDVFMLQYLLWDYFDERKVSLIIWRKATYFRFNDAFKVHNLLEIICFWDWDWTNAVSYCQKVHIWECRLKLAENNQELAELEEICPQVFKKVSRVSLWLITASFDLVQDGATGVILWNYTAPVASFLGANFDLLSRVCTADSKP